MPAGKIATAIYTEQLGTVFRQMPIALAVNRVNGALTAIILSLLAAGSLPKIRFLAVVLVTGGRWVLWWRYHHSSSSKGDRLWSRFRASPCNRVELCKSKAVPAREQPSSFGCRKPLDHHLKPARPSVPQDTVCLLRYDNDLNLSLIWRMRISAAQIIHRCYSPHFEPNSCIYWCDDTGALTLSRRAALRPPRDPK